MRRGAPLAGDAAIGKNAAMPIPMPASLRPVIARTVIALLLTGMMLASAGCAADRSKKTLLQETLYAYAGAIRWNQFDGAWEQFVDPAVRAAQPLTAIDRARYQQVSVTGYHVKGAAPVSETEFAQTVEIGLVNRHTQAGRVVMTREVWQWDEARRRWWLTSGLPDITGSDQ